MSVRECCQNYRSPSRGYWKTSLGHLVDALEAEKHPDQTNFKMVAISLMMLDRPGYSYWLERAITKLIDDPQARLDPVPDFPDYDEMSVQDLVDKYGTADENFPKEEVLTELKYRYPLLIQSDQVESLADLKEKLKDVL